MRKDDFLKKYIDEHRQDFDDEKLPSELFSKIMDKTVQQRSRKKRRMLFYAAAAACVLLVLNAVFFLQSQKSAKNLHNTSISNTANEQIQLDEVVKDNHPLPEKANTVEPTETFPPVKKSFVKSSKVLAQSKVRSTGPADENTYDLMLSDLEGNESVSGRIDAILKAAEYTNPNEKLKNSLRLLFANDNNSNVRLAALHVLAVYKSDSTTREYLINGMSSEKDPVIQMELVRIMRDDTDSAVTEKLVEMANYPFTIKEVKDQVYYALLIR